MKAITKILIFTAFISSLFLTGCEIKVDGADDACENHRFLPASCESPAKCENCGFERGEPSGHIFTAEATCTKPQICEVCGYTDGKTAEHKYSEKTERTATCEREGIIKLTCTDCGAVDAKVYSLEKQNAGDVFLKTKASVCEIRVYSYGGNEISLGTGFVYGSDGKIVTNYHVIHGGYSAKAIFDGIPYHIESVLAYDRDIDLTVLKVADIDIEPLTVCKNTHPVGMPVYAFGSSRGLTATFSNGIITYDRRVDEGVEYIQHSAAVSSGNSGGPLINEYGEVIGINTFEIEDSQNLNFAVSVTELDRLVYTEPKSLAQIAEAEQSVLGNLSGYIVENGSFINGENVYELKLYNEQEADGTKYQRYMTYYPDHNLVSVRNTVYSGSIDYGASAELFFDNNRGRYSWYYYDSRNQQIKGIMNAGTVRTDSKLSYNETNITDSQKLDSSLNAANSLIQIILQNLDEDFKGASLCAEDFGFVNY